MRFGFVETRSSRRRWDVGGTKEGRSLPFPSTHHWERKEGWKGPPESPPLTPTSTKVTLPSVSELLTRHKLPVSQGEDPMGRRTVPDTTPLCHTVYVLHHLVNEEVKYLLFRLRIVFILRVGSCVSTLLRPESTSVVGRSRFHLSRTRRTKS